MKKFTLLNKATSTKLFKTSSNLVEYVVIEEELNDLFDFCMLIQESTLQKTNDLSLNCKELEQEPYRRYDFDGISFNNEDILQGIKDFEIPSWTEILQFTVPMNQILLISIFLEKSLKGLCAEYDPNNESEYYGGYDFKLRKPNRESTIHFYIKFLENTCKIENLSDSTIAYLNQNLRPLRNSFVHGDRNLIEKYSGEININKVFTSVSELFHIIESQYTTKNER